MIPFNYHHFFYFYTIAQTGSVSKASEKLRLAQPTLSAQLKQFENYLNLKLFQREGKRLVLTDEGRYLLSYAKEIFNIGQELMDNLSDLSHKGRLRIQIGVSNYTPKSFVDAFLQFILKTNSSVYMSVHEDKTEKMIDDLRKHVLDLVLTDTPSFDLAQDEIENHLVGKIPIVFCAHPKIARRYSKIPRDLHQAPLILPTAQSQVYQAVQEYFISKHIEPKIIAEIEDVELVRRLVLKGIGIAPLNEFTAKLAPSREPLVILDKNSKINIFENIYLLVRKRKKSHPLLPQILKQFKISI